MTKIKEGYKETEIGVIPEDWKVCKIDDVISFLKSGLSRKLSDTDIGIPCLRSSNIIDGRLKLDDLKYWFIEDPQGAKIEEYIVNEGDILVNFINSIAQIGKTCIFDNPAFKTIYTTNVFRIKTDSEIMDNKFFFYNTQTKSYSYQISLITKPAVNQASFTTGDFKSIKFPLPPLPEQQRIAEILSTTDSHIEKMDKTIEDYQLLKKGMMKKLLTEGIGHTEFKETEIGRIPKEWEIAKLSVIVKNRSKKYVPCDAEDFPYVALEHINQESGRLNGIGKSSESTSTKSVFYKNDVLFGKLRPYLRKYWLSDIDGVCSTEILALQPLSNPEFAFYTVQTDKFIEDVSKKAFGTKMPRTSWADIKDYLFPLPPLQEQQDIARIISVIDEKIYKLEFQKSDFVQLKKSLMEKLLTGKVRVI